MECFVGLDMPAAAGIGLADSEQVARRIDLDFERVAGQTVDFGQAAAGIAAVAGQTADSGRAVGIALDSIAGQIGLGFEQAAADTAAAAFGSEPVVGIGLDSAQAAEEHIDRAVVAEQV